MPLLRRLKSKWVRLLFRLTATLGAVLLLFGGYFYMRYPGFVSDLLLEARSAKPSELYHQYAFLVYYGEYYGKLRENPQTAVYDFTSASLEGRGNAFERGKLAYHAGDFQSAVDLVARDIHERGENESKLYWLGLSYQRLGEAGNCAEHCLHGDSAPFCSLPLARTHLDRGPSEKAAETFLNLLDNYDDTNNLYRWLLNFTYMTLGDFPDGVPRRYRIASDFIETFYGQRRDAIRSEFSHLRFRERAAELKVNANDAGKGVAVEDFDRDGDLDIITGGTFSDLKYYRNQQGKSFVDQTEEAGLGGTTQAHIITAADYDNDGWIDLFVSRPFHRYHLFRNTGAGRFRDVTFDTGLLPREPKEDEAVYSCVSAWGDVNNDGYLDLFVAQFGQRIPFTSGLLSRLPMSSKLFVNTPDATHESLRRFRDATAEFGLEDVVADRIFLGAALGDYDRDGWTDLFLSSYFGGRSCLLKNVDGQRFEKTNLIRTARTGFTAAFLDINHDGQVDIFHGGHGSARNVVENAVFSGDSIRTASAVFVQQNGKFKERCDVFRAGLPIGTMGTSFGDINNDGAFDFYLGTGNPEGAFVLPNLFYIGETDGGRCTGFARNATVLEGLGTIQKGHGIVFFDFDNDGDQDIYSSLGGMWPGDAWPNQLFVNDSRSDSHWVKIRLRGRQTNYYGVGAVIRIEAKRENGDSIQRYYHMNNKTGFGSAPYLAHIGLMDAVSIERIDVSWPVSQQTRVYSAELDRMYELDESGSSSIVPLLTAAE